MLDTTNERPTEFGISVKLKAKGDLRTMVTPQPEKVFIRTPVWPEASWSNWWVFTKMVLTNTWRRLTQWL